MEGGYQNGIKEDEYQKRLVSLIDELTGEHCFETYAQLQHAFLRRVENDDLFESEEARVAFKAKEDSVFDRVEQHKLNERNKLDLYEEQFRNAHDGIDHKTFTERWLFDNTGEDVKLDRVLQNPSMSDFIGVYDIQPMTAYIASKLIIDEHDFMGLFDLHGREVDSRPGTYNDIASDVVAQEDQDAIQGEEEKKQSARELHEETIQHDEEFVNSLRKLTENMESASLDVEQDVSGCGGCDCSAKPHGLGEGQFLQFKLRKENVVQFLDNSLISKRLLSLLPDDPQELIYVFTVSANGVMRFHPWGGIRRKMWHGYGDSEKVRSFATNIAHAATYGCFCFGIVYKECENYKDRFGHVKKGGRTIVMRYNRWATSNAPVYAMVRQHADESDKTVPPQDGIFAHYTHVLARRLHISRSPAKTKEKS